jgi:hypothetical protein
LLSLQALAADHIYIVGQGMLLLRDLSKADPAAAASAVAQPLLQLLGPAVMHCLQQQLQLQQLQQQQQQLLQQGEVIEKFLQILQHVLSHSE